MSQLSSHLILPATPEPVLPSDQTNFEEVEETFWTRGIKVPGQVQGIKGHVYDLGPTKSIELFAKKTHEIGEYLACTIKIESEFWNTFAPEKLGFEIIDQRPEPEDLNNPVLVK
jgi:hypothetical protein